MKKISSDRCEDIDYLIKNFDALGYNKHAIIPDSNVYDEEFIAKEKALNELIDATLKHLLYGNEEPNEDEKITITVPQSFDQEVFDINKVIDSEFQKWQKAKSGSKGRGKCLFVTRKFTKKFLHDWVVEYSAWNNMDTRKKNKEEIAIGKGGPTRQFLSQFWGQIELLAVPHTSKTLNKQHQIQLFSLHSGGLCPELNLNLEDGVRNATKRKTEDIVAALNKRIDQYYRMVGLILFRSIVGNYSISSKVMGRFMRNVLLRNCEPRDKDKYPEPEVMIDCRQLGGNFKVEDLKNKTIREVSDDFSFDADEATSATKIDSDNFSTLFMQMAFVESRRRAIDAIKLGISLDGAIIDYFIHAFDRTFLTILLRLSFTLYFSVEEIDLGLSKTPVGVISKCFFAKKR